LTLHGIDFLFFWILF